MTATPPAHRLLIVSHAAELGGAEFVLLDVARHYGARCHVLLFAEGPLTARLAALGIGCTVLPAGQAVTGVRREAGRARALAAAPAVAALAWRVASFSRGFEVVHANSQKAAVVTMCAALLSGRKIVWHLHDILSPGHFAPAQRWLVTRLANRAARRVVVVSAAARDAFVRAGGDPSLAVVVPNGFDAARLPAGGEADRAALRAACGVGEVTLLGAFSRLAPWKGQHVLLRALAELPGVHAAMVGGALFGHEDHAAGLRALAAELGVADRVHWLGQRDDVAALMRGVDMVVHSPTEAEPFGRVIVEGMLAGRPVIATDLGAAREVLGDDAAALVPADDPQRLAEAVRHMLALPRSELAALGARNRARAQALFSLEGMLRSLDDVIALDGDAPGRVMERAA